MERGGDFDADVQHIEFRQFGFLFDSIVQAAVVGQFHDQIRLAVKLIEHVDMDDVGMVKGGAGPRLAVKTFQNLFVFGHFALEQLDRHLPLQHHIQGAIDGAHSSRGNDLLQFKLPQTPGKNDRMAAFGAGDCFEWGQITWNPVAVLASAANGSAQWPALLGGGRV